MVVLSCLAARAPLDEFVLLNGTTWLITDDVVLIKFLHHREDLVPHFAS